MARTRGLYWVTNDLRLDDNPTLALAASRVDELLIVFAPSRAWSDSPWLDEAASPMRWQFLNDSLQHLDSQLRKLGQRLVTTTETACRAWPAWLAHWRPNEVFAAEQAGWYERSLWQAMAARYPNTRFNAVDSHTLFARNALPFECMAESLPGTFSAFRRRVEALNVTTPASAVRLLPPPPVETARSDEIEPLLMSSTAISGDPAFEGGEAAATRHLNNYLGGEAPHQYKSVRNALEGWENSTKFSAWLATGCLSARRIVANLKRYESTAGASESTYWIFFELLWREYFQWYAHAHGARLFNLSGIREETPVADRDSHKLLSWQRGETDFPIVNACMKQLAATGYMSNRGRQLAASCFVNELGMDWRLGAAWFEHHLLDYDVGSNWGNWQYLAGVGADPRGKRRFDLKKQANTYDPDGSFVQRWCGDA